MAPATEFGIETWQRVCIAGFTVPIVALAKRLQPNVEFAQRTQAPLETKFNGSA